MISSIIMQIVVVWSYMTMFFIIALYLQKNDVADIAWGGGFVVVAITTLMLQSTVTPRALLALSLVFVWGLRLALYIGSRNLGRPEDKRYQQWRQEWGAHATVRSFFQIFLLQGLLIVIISIPVTYSIMSAYSPLNFVDCFGSVLWLAGFLFETVGDSQLAEFKKDAANKGRIITNGLWRYTRHPNYFGEVLLWWGIYVIALSTPMGWVTIIGPLTITFLILQVSGIPLLEKKYEGNEEFMTYKQRTSAFFPLPPRQ